MELNISDLIIETTRKCNMKCEHCLRGASQRKTIDNHYVYKILRLLDNVGILTFGGGEPTLAMDTLNYIKHYIIYEECDVQNFYMVTNGKAINIEEVAEWTYNMYNVCSDNEMSGIGFSFDRFHIDTLDYNQEEKQKRNYCNLQEKIEYKYGIVSSTYDNFVRKHSDGSWNSNSLLKQGRAKDFGSKDNKVRPFEEDTYNNTVYFNDNELYLTCQGYLVAGCNWSYNSMDNNKDIQIAHIDDILCTDDLIEAIRTYNKKTAKQKILV